MILLKRGIIHTIEIIFTYLHPADIEHIRQAKKSLLMKQSIQGIKIDIVIIDPDYKKCFFPKAVIYVKIDLRGLLKTDYVTESSFTKIESIVYDYLSETLGIDFHDHKLKVVDFSFDYELPREEMALFLSLYRNQTMSETHKYIKDLSTPTTYFNSCKGRGCKNITSKSKALRVYDKFSESLDEKDKNLLRFEVSLKNGHLNYKKYSLEMEKKISSYLIESLSFQYFIAEFSKVIYKSDFHKFDIAVRKIRASDLSGTQKSKLLWFVNVINKHSLETVYNNLKKYKLSEHKFRTYIRWLDNINVNVLFLPEQTEVNSIVNPVRYMMESSI